MNTDDGGAVYINSKCTTTVTGCKFMENEADDEGGAIYTDSAYGKVNLYSNIFVDNKAEYKGHAVYNSGEFGTVNGKKQVAFTDEKGYVTVNMTADKAGSYRVDLRFAGDRYYNELGSYRTIRVV